MSERPVVLLLYDILEAFTRIEEYISELTNDDFIDQHMVTHAVERNIEIIGEACHKLPEEFTSMYSDIEWHKAIGMRNRLIHGYFSVDIPMLWNTATMIIPIFKRQIETPITKEF